MPAFLAASSCVPSCEPSMAPTISTFAPFSIIALIWFCCSVTPPLANWTLGVYPAALSPSLNRPSARTQFSDVFWGSATPMTASLAKPAALELPPAAVSVRPPPQPDSARALTTAIAATALANFLISTSSFVRQPFWPFRFPPRPRLAGGESCAVRATDLQARSHASYAAFLTAAGVSPISFFFDGNSNPVIDGLFCDFCHTSSATAARRTRPLIIWVASDPVSYTHLR